MPEGDEGDEGSIVDAMADAATTAVDTVVGAFTTPDPAGPSGASLGVAEAPLKEAIKSALKAAKTSAHSAGNGGEHTSADGADPIIETLGESLGNAIHNYFMSAWVDIGSVQSIAAPGIVCETLGIPPFRPVAAGATLVPIIPVHHAAPGWGKLK
jgi:hypothetical protein